MNPLVVAATAALAGFGITALVTDGALLAVGLEAVRRVVSICERTCGFCAWVKLAEWARVNRVHP